MHHLAYLTALHDERGLHSLLHGYEVMVHGTHRKERRDGCMRGVHSAVGEYDIVSPLVHRRLRLTAQTAERGVQGCFSALRTEYSRQLNGVESLVAYVAEDVELGVCEHGVRQSHHLAVRLVGQQDVHAHRTDVLRERHDKFLADGVNGRIGDLSELLPEVVEEQLGTVGQHCERRVVAHGGSRLGAVDTHRLYDKLHILARISERPQLSGIVVHAVLRLASAAQGVQLNAVG
ncbi:putative uncharacterized protein [Prevotella sp. CAG:487]|nr:putative uncharacterized protein [Prevotella sp. CAG:487]